MQDVNINLKLKPRHDRRIRRRHGKRGKRYRHFNRGAYTNKLKTFFLKDSDGEIIYETPFNDRVLNNPRHFKSYKMTASIPSDTSIAGYGIKVGNNDVKLKKSEITIEHESPSCLLDGNTPYVSTSSHQPSPYNAQKSHTQRDKGKVVKRNGTKNWYLDAPLKFSEYCGIVGPGAIDKM